MREEPAPDSGPADSGDMVVDVAQVSAAFRRQGAASHAGTGTASAAQEAEVAALLFVLDLQEGLASVQRLRRWSAAALAVSSGETLVDVGCGAGTALCELAERVQPGGRAIGVEPHAGLREAAAARAAASASAVEFIPGDALELPFEDGSVDVLRTERVWQHLDDPAQAAREVARVLAPGGRAAILDTDWATLITEPGDLQVARRINDSLIAARPNGLSGRSLRRHLVRAGLRVDPDIGSSALVFPDTMLRGGSILQQNVSGAVESGAITAAEGDRFVTEFLAAAEREEAFVAVTMFSVVARVAG